VTLSIPLGASLARPRPPEELADPLRVPELFRPAPELEAWVRATFLADGAPLLNEDHAHLTQAVLGVLWTNVSNRRQQRTILATAEQPTPRGAKWAIARAEHQLVGWFGAVPDFLLTFDAPIAEQLDDTTWCALVEHELYHCAQALDDFGAPKWHRDGTPMFAMRGHDVARAARPGATRARAGGVRRRDPLAYFADILGWTLTRSRKKCSTCSSARRASSSRRQQPREDVPPRRVRRLRHRRPRGAARRGVGPRGAGRPRAAPRPGPRDGLRDDLRGDAHARRARRGARAPDARRALGEERALARAREVARRGALAAEARRGRTSRTPRAGGTTATRSRSSRKGRASSRRSGGGRGHVLLGGQQDREPFNPTEPQGPAYQRAQSGAYSVIHLDAFQHPNVVERAAVIPDAVSFRVIDARVRTDCRDRGPYPETPLEPLHGDFVYALPPKGDAHARDDAGARPDGILGAVGARPHVYRPNAAVHGAGARTVADRERVGPLQRGARRSGNGALGRGRGSRASRRTASAAISRARVGTTSSPRRGGARAPTPCSGVRARRRAGARRRRRAAAHARIRVGVFRVLPKGDGVDTARSLDRLFPDSPLTVDIGGVGASPYDHLVRVLGRDVVGVSFGAKALPRVPGEPWCENLRTQLYVRLAMLTHAGLADLPNDPALRAELLAHESAARPTGPTSSSFHCSRNPLSAGATSAASSTPPSAANRSHRRP
jgi:hypothetical protein